MLKEILLGLGVFGLLIFVCVILLLPLVCAIILWTYIATSLGLTGLVLMGFWILFGIIMMCILGMII